MFVLVVIVCLSMCWCCGCFSSCNIFRFLTTSNLFGNATSVGLQVAEQLMHHSGVSHSRLFALVDLSPPTPLILTLRSSALPVGRERRNSFCTTEAPPRDKHMPAKTKRVNVKIRGSGGGGMDDIVFVFVAATRWCKNCSAHR